ncbi:MAG: hypothetical protein WAT79_01085, partial [Saprospiraceae bacterium]
MQKCMIAIPATFLLFRILLLNKRSNNATDRARTHLDIVERSVAILRVSTLLIMPPLFINYFGQGGLINYRIMGIDN